MILKSLFTLSCLVLLIFSVFLGVTHSFAWRPSNTDWIWNHGGSFEMPAYNDWRSSSGEEAEYEEVPWGRDYWGLHAYSWEENGDVTGLAYYIFEYRSGTALDGHYLYMGGRESAGKWGTITCIQGDIWNWAARFGDKMWNVPMDMLTTQRALTIMIDIRKLQSGNIGSELLPWNDRIMYALNVWLYSPELNPSRMVLDIIFYLGPGDNADRFVDENAYHYQVEAAEYPIPDGVDTHCEVQLSSYIHDALNFFDILYAEDTLHLYQVEFLLEVKRAYASCSIDDFYLVFYNPPEYEQLRFADLNKDRHINIMDIAIVGAYFGSKIGEAKYTPGRDVDHNEIVNIIDLSRVAKVYDRQY